MGTCVDHANNVNASADLSFEWNWGGDETTIDGFEVALFASDTGSVHGIADVIRVFLGRNPPGLQARNDLVRRQSDRLLHDGLRLPRGLTRR